VNPTQKIKKQEPFVGVEKYHANSQRNTQMPTMTMFHVLTIDAVDKQNNRR
jgi:hypothetical protein